MKTPVRILIIAAGVVASAWMLRYSLAPNVPNGHIPEDFPNPWIAIADQGHPERLVIVPGRIEPQAPYLLNGAELYPAWRCLNPNCPGRIDGVSFLFAGNHDPECPRCHARPDHGGVERWYTPEGQAIVDRIRATYAP